jgi:predicted HTH domain antitoxin
MLRYEILYLVSSQQLEEETAAEMLEVPVRTLKAILTKYGKRIKKMPEALSPLQERAETVTERTKSLNKAAKMLGISVRQVRRLLEKNEISIKRPASFEKRLERAENAKEKWKKRQNAALSVIAGADDMESAATFAEVSSRQMYRWVNKLLSVEQVKIRDLQEMRRDTRAALARKLENAEVENRH